MKIYYAPSGKRMIPYPPMAPAILAGSLKENDVRSRVIDLEIETWVAEQEGKFWPQNREILDAYDILKAETWDRELSEFASRLIDLSKYQAGEPIAISTMGFEQMASSMILTKTALKNGSRVILGGQYWTENTAKRVLSIVKDPKLTIVISDGYEAIVQWAKSNEIPINGLRWESGDFVKGEQKSALTQPPIPEYQEVNWLAYDKYAEKYLGAKDLIRRAHLYVWDKQCPYKCTFCRVSTGSNVKLSPPEKVAQNMTLLLDQNIKQFNFMTNEINPTLSYMRRFLKALEPRLDGVDDISWFTYMRPDNAEEEDFKKLRELGCRLLRYGVETGSQRLSDLMKKEYKIETIEKVLKLASEAGIWNHVNFLIGFPGEIESDIEESLQFIDRVAPYLHSVRINPFYLPPDSPMAREPEKNGIRLGKFQNGFWDFQLADGSRDDPKTIEHRIELVSDRVKKHEIGFAGVLPFETLDFLSRYSSRDAAISAMRIARPYMWESSSADWLKGQLGAYHAPIEWQASIYQRGRNYSLTLCND